MPYFHIMTGLRGCYMPDNAYVVQVKTRRDLKAIIAFEAEPALDGHQPVVGLSKKAIARFAAWCWRERKASQSMPFVLPWGYKGQNSGQPYGIFVSNATRKDHQEYLATVE